MSVEITVTQNAPSGTSFGSIFITILSAITAEKDKFTQMGDNIYPEDYGPKLLSKGTKPFDFVIVGAGPGGCILANKLTENPKWTVLLLEAGDAPSVNTEIPYLYPTLASTESAWAFTSSSDNFCKGSVSKTCHFTRGKALGGSSTINNLHYERGTHRDFKFFEEWNFSRDILPSYESLEQYKGNQSMGSLLGTKGALELNDLPSDNDLSDVILAAAKELAYDKVVYPEQELGYKTSIGTIANGERNNIAKAFLGPIRSRSNLFVARNSMATKILTNLPKDRRVTGVEVKIGDKTVEVRAKLEVILCAGAINTAKLLLISGFGPRDQLSKLDITTVVDLPVGKNLRDHIGLPMFVSVQNAKSDSHSCEDKSKTNTEELDSAFYYLAHREGKLSGTGLNNLAGAINTRKDPYSASNVKIYHQYFASNDKTFKPFLESLGYKPSLINSLTQHNCQKAIVAFMPTIIDAKSMGEVTLKDNKIETPAVIKGNYVSDPERSDYFSLVSAYDFVQALVETEPLAEGVKAEVLDVQLDECKNINKTTDQYVDCYIRSFAIPMGQVVGTAKIGDNTQDEGDMVVNDKLLVEGIRHLRIVDSSVIPEPISANVECTVAMMGVKIAEDIKNLWTK